MPSSTMWMAINEVAFPGQLQLLDGEIIDTLGDAEVLRERWRWHDDHV